MSEDIRGVKAICQLVGGVCWVTAKKKIAHLERRTGMKLLEYEDGRPIVSRSVYCEARQMLAKKD